MYNEGNSVGCVSAELVPTREAYRVADEPPPNTPDHEPEETECARGSERETSAKTVAPKGGGKSVRL